MWLPVTLNSPFAATMVPGLVSGLFVVPSPQSIVAEYELVVELGLGSVIVATVCVPVEVPSELVRL